MVVASIAILIDWWYRTTQPYNTYGGQSIIRQEKETLFDMKFNHVLLDILFHVRDCHLENQTMFIQGIFSLEVNQECRA